MRKATFHSLLVGFVTCCAAFAMPAAQAGRLVGDYSIRSSDYRLQSLNKLDNTGLLLLSNGSEYGVCTSVLVSKYYALTSAHCFAGAKVSNPTSAVFASLNGNAFVTSYMIHKNFNYGTYYNTTGSNTPQQAAYDIALIRLDKDMEQLGLTYAPLQPSTVAPSSPFIGSFAGFGEQGNGASQTICNVQCSSNTNLAEIVLDSILGGENSINVFPSFFASDFDDGSFLRNIDNSPLLSYEFAPDIGDSGAGLFDATGKLVGLVAGGGYGTKVTSSGNIFKYEPVTYGSLSIYTPLHIHAGWLTNAMQANLFPSTTIPISSTPNALTEVPFDPSYGFSGELFISGSLFDEGLVQINDMFSEIFSQEVYDNVYASTEVPPNPSETVPGPFPLLGVGAALVYSRKLRKRISLSKAMPIDRTID